MRRGWRTAAVLATGATLLGLAWGLGPRSAPPLYDSGPIIAENYRYLHTPAGFKGTPPPASIDVTLNLLQGQSPPMAETTSELPAQAQLLAAQNAFAVPPGVIAVHVVIRAVEPPPTAPPDGALDGNVYEFLVTAPAGTTPLPLKPSQQVTVVLRGPAGVQGAELELWDGTAMAWKKLDTQPLGGTSPDSYAANVSELGDIALVAPPQTAGDSGGSGGIIVAVVVIAIVVAAAAVVLVLRRRT